MLTFIKEIIIGQKKRYLTIAMVFAILFCFDFILVVMLTNIPNDTDSLSPLIASILIMLVILISFILLLFINNFFISEKSDEFSIILLSGRNVLQISKYIIIQFGTLFILTATIGGLLGYFFINNIHYIFNNMLMIEIFKIHSLLKINYYFIALLAIKLCFLFIIDFGKFMDIKFRIVEYMNHIQKHKTKVSFFSTFIVEKEKKSFPIWQFTIVFLSLFIIITSIQHIIVIKDFVSLLIYFTSSLIALVFFIKYFIPFFLDIFHNNWLIKQPKILIAINRLIYLMKAMFPLTLINSLLIPFMFFLISIPKSSFYLLEITIICYLMLLIMIIISYIFRASIYIPSKSKDIATLKAIGYSKKEIYTIHLIEVFLFFLFSALLPFIIYITVVYKSYTLLYINGTMITILIICYFFAYLFVAIYMIHSYISLTKGVIKDVKYLNRSE